MKQPMYRQGDVLLIKVSGPEFDFKTSRGGILYRKDPAKAGVVLAYGEVTGHAHVLEAEKVEALTTDKTSPWDAAAERYIRVLEETSLKHLDLPAGGSPTGEHADIPLDPGLYKVVRQREWTDDMERTRYVSD